MGIHARTGVLRHWAIDNHLPTASAMALRAGVHQRTMCRVLAGEAVSTTTMDAVCNLTGLPPGALFEIRGTRQRAGEDEPVMSEAG